MEGAVIFEKQLIILTLFGAQASVIKFEECL
jgi:hypothetical protein